MMVLAAHDRAPFKFNGKIDRLKINSTAMPPD